MVFCQLLVYNIIYNINDWWYIMIEDLYNEMLKSIRNFINSSNRNNFNEQQKIVTFLTESINRANFLNRNDLDTKILENRLIRELRKFSKNMFIRTNNKHIYLKKMQRNIDFLAWINKSIDINTSGTKYTVAQREIFYANLGYNIGSEQNGRRPVIILQNDTGNINGNTTIVAPVTTHQKRIKWDNDKHKYYVRMTEDGIEKRKYLDFYEVPLRLEGKQNGLYGFVNVMHLKEIDRKRIDSSCLGIATEKCFDDIIKAINKNLS